MAIPLRHDRRRLAAVNHAQTVEHHDDRPVSLVGASAHIDHGKVAVGNLVIVKLLGHSPDGEQALPVLTEAEIRKSLLALVGIGIHLANILRLAAVRLKPLDKVFVEHHRTRMDKRLHIIRRELRSHDRKVVLTSTLVHIPMYGFK